MTRLQWNTLNPGNTIVGKYGRAEVLRRTNDDDAALAVYQVRYGQNGNDADGSELQAMTPEGWSLPPADATSIPDPAPSEPEPVTLPAGPDALHASAQSEVLIPTQLLRPNPWNRKRFDEKALVDLAESLRRRQIQAILVRPAEDGMYEIVAGERRWRACVLGDLPAVRAVVDPTITDKEVREACLTENVQREDVHPLEEAELLRAMVDSGDYGTGTAAVAQLAAMVKKSLRYVYDRLKFADLCESARAEFLADAISASHAVLLSRLKPKDQKAALEFAVFDRYNDRRRDEPASIRSLQEWVDREITLPLAKARWDLNRADLPGGACRACAKRTCAALDLLEGKPDPNDRCLDKACFKRKEEVASEERIRAALASNPEAVKVNLDYGAKRVKGVLDRSDIEVAKETDPGARPAVLVDDWYGGGKAGDVVYVRDTRSAAAREREAAEKQKKDEQIAKLRAVRQEMVRILAEGCGSEVPEWLLRELAWNAYERVWTENRKQVARDFGFPKKAVDHRAAVDALDQRQLIRFALVCLSCGEAYPSEWNLNQPAATIERLLRLDGYDLAAVEAEARKAAKEAAKNHA